MRYIDTQPMKNSIPTDWETRMEEALSSARIIANDSTTSVTDRRKAIAAVKLPKVKNMLPWTYLKPALAELSAGKCWYCESSTTRSYPHVDHFRPKGAVKEVSDHLGYWWLAFDPGNYRFSCAWCNSKGKGKKFPVADEKNRCFHEQDTLDDEKPVLLDPIDPRDPELLAFQPTGGVIPAALDTRGFEYSRADQTIRILLLVHQDIVERRFAVSVSVRTVVKRANRSLPRCKDDNESRELFAECVKEILAMIDERAEYSAAARATLAACCVESSWIRPLLEDE